MPKRATLDRDAAKFGALVRNLRQAHGWTLIQFGRAAKMNPTYLGFLERGQNIPSLTVILHLARVLGAKASDLIRQVEQDG